MPPDSRSESRSKHLVAVLLATLVTIGLGFATVWLLERERLVPRNVVLVVVDTLRADHLAPMRDSCRSGDGRGRP